MDTIRGRAASPVAFMASSGAVRLGAPRRVAWMALAALGLMAGCRQAKPVQTGPAGGTMPIRVFAETAPMAGLVASGQTLWAGSERGLRRWTLSSPGAEPLHERMDRRLGLPGRRVSALVTDGEDSVWVATDGGVGRIDGDRYRQAAPSPGHVVSLMPPPQWPEGEQPNDVLALLEGGAVQRFESYRWQPVPELQSVKVTALVRDADGATIWVGTADRGLMRIGKDRVPRAIPELAELEAKEIASLAMVGPGAVAAIAKTGGADRLILVHPATPPEELRASPELPLARVMHVGRQTLLLAGPPDSLRFYTLEPIERGTPAPEDGFRLLPIRKATDTIRYAAAPLKLRVPPEPTVHAVVGRQIYFGTRALGVARAADPAPRFLRGGDILDDANHLSVACTPDRCFVATGGHQVWRWDGQQLLEEEVGQGKNPDTKVLTLARDSASAVLAIMREPDFRGFVIRRFESDGWKEYRRLEVDIPEGVPALSFATLSPAGTLWLGLRHVLDGGQEMGDGALELTSMSGRALRHRPPPPGDTSAPELVPAPLDVRAALFEGQTIWFAGADGVWRWQDGKVRRWGENDSMESEVCHAISRGPGDKLWVATSAGVHVWEKDRFRLRGGLTDSYTHALARDVRGRLWAATQKGLVMVETGDGGRETEQRWNTQNGLCDDDILDVTTDPFGRVWALGASAIAVVGP